MNLSVSTGLVGAAVGFLMWFYLFATGLKKNARGNWDATPMRDKMKDIWHPENIGPLIGFVSFFSLMFWSASGIIDGATDKV